MKVSPLTNKLLALAVTLVLVGSAIPMSVAQGASTVLKLKPAADATVEAASPNSNFGTRNRLNSDGSPVIRSYIRFTVPALNGAKITNARLRMYAADGSASGITISKTADSWSETGITFKNAPAIGSTLVTLGRFADLSWIDVDVTSAVQGAGNVNFVLNTKNDTTNFMSSREATSNTPELVLTLSSTVSPTNQPAPTKAPTNQPAPTNPPAPTSAPTKAPAPTAGPTSAPTKAPTAVPTKAPTALPTKAPTTPPSSGGVAPFGASGSWNLKFSDDFSSGRLDTGKWEPNWLAGNSTTITKPINGSESSCYDPAQVSVGAFGGASGALKLSAVSRSCRASNGTTYSSASGIVTTSGKYTFTHGFMEARVWMDGTSSTLNWPAFWADGTGQWPTTGEIDVMEGLGGRPAWHFHWGSSGSPQQVGGAPSMSSKVGWHTFGADWETGSIKFYYDGVMVGQATSGVTNSPMFLILNLGISSSISGPIKLPSDFLVDYVRVWQH
jgi:hypothetical protein